MDDLKKRSSFRDRTVSSFFVRDEAPSRLQHAKPIGKSGLECILLYVHSRNF